MAKMKWDINGKGVPAAEGGEFTGYNGPDLPKGSWPAKVKRMEVQKIVSNTENKGKPRIRVLLEVQTIHLADETKHKYHGHPVWDGLNIITSSMPFVNAFLHGLTDGSAAANRAIEAAFWDQNKGPDFKRIKLEKGPRAGEVETHITKIGNVSIDSPKGEKMVQVTTRVGKNNKTGEFQAEVTGYIPFDGENPNAPSDSDDDDMGDDDIDGDDMLDDEDDDDEDDEDEDEDVDPDDDDESEDDDSNDDDEDDVDEDDAENEPVTAGRKGKPF